MIDRRKVEDICGYLKLEECYDLVPPGKIDEAVGWSYFAGYEYEDGHVSAMAIQWRGKGERRMWHDSPDGRTDLEVRRPVAVLFDVGEDT